MANCLQSIESFVDLASATRDPEDTCLDVLFVGWPDHELLRIDWPRQETVEHWYDHAMMATILDNQEHYAIHLQPDPVSSEIGILQSIWRWLRNCVQ